MIGFRPLIAANNYSAVIDEKSLKKTTHNAIGIKHYLRFEGKNACFVYRAYQKEVKSHLQRSFANSRRKCRLNLICWQFTSTYIKYNIPVCLERINWKASHPHIRYVRTSVRSRLFIYSLLAIAFENEI